MAKVYDPLELLSPYTVQSKILVQELWNDQYGSDDALAYPFRQNGASGFKT